MSDKTYEIIIRYDGEGTPQAQSPVATPQQAKAPQAMPKDFSQYVIAKTIQPYAMQAVSYTVGNVGLTTGSTELQQKADLARTAVDTVVGGYVAAKSGAVMAASFGLSTGAGAAVAVAIFAASKAVDYGFKVAKQNLDKAVEAEQLSLNRTRAGIAWNQRGD